MNLSMGAFPRHRRRIGMAAGKGTTILEFLLYIAIVGLVLVTVVRFMADFSSSQAKAAALAEASHNARFALSRIEAELREASDLNVGSTVFDVHPGTLSLATASAPANPTVFAIVNGALTVQQGAGLALPLTNSRVEVTSFVLRDVSVAGRTRAVRITLTLRHRNTGNLSEFDAETTVETTVRVHARDGFGS